MKTMELKLSQQGSTENYNTEGITSGNSANISYRVSIKEDGSQVGDANFNFNLNLYSMQNEVEYTNAAEALNTKIQAAIKAFDEALRK